MPSLATLAVLSIACSGAPRESLPSGVAAVVWSVNEERRDFGAAERAGDWEAVAERSGLTLAREDGYAYMWPSKLFGISEELEQVTGLVSLIEKLREQGRVRGSELPVAVVRDAERTVSIATPSNFRPADSIAEADFAIGIHGWYQLTVGEKSVWVMTPTHTDTSGFAPVRCNEPRSKVEAPPVPEPPRFEHFPGLRVDLYWPEGREPSIREKTEIAAKAMELFGKEVVAASDAIRKGYARFFREVSGSGWDKLREGLTVDARTTSDLPSEIRGALQDSLLGGFERHGFSSRADAELFFAKATVSSRRARLSLDFAIETPKGRHGFSGEFSGSFTPRG